MPGAARALLQKGSALVLVVPLLSACNSAPSEHLLWSKYYVEGHDAMSLGNYDLAQRQLDAALKIADSLPSEDPRRAWCLADAAALRCVKGEYRAALPFYERALPIAEKSFGAENAETATIMHDMAKVYIELGNFNAALPLLKRVISIDRSRFGKHDPTLGSALMTLGTLYRGQHDLKNAERYYTEALKVQEAALGKNDPRLALALHNMADLYQDTGRANLCLPLYTRALSIKKRMYGDTDARVAVTMNSVADWHLLHGDFASAEDNYRKCISIAQAAGTAEKMHLGLYMVNLSTVLMHTNRADEAIKLLAKAKTLIEESRGPISPEAAQLLFTYGTCLVVQNRQLEATDYFNQAIAVTGKVFGNKSPQVARIIADVQQVYHTKSH